MPDDEHLAVLRRGAAAWNAWRAEHDEVPDLSRAGLRGLDLSGFDVSRADLQGADLRGTNCSGANLAGAHLEGANLFKAVLDGADLAGAYLHDAQFLNCAQPGRHPELAIGVLRRRPRLRRLDPAEDLTTIVLSLFDPVLARCPSQLGMFREVFSFTSQAHPRLRAVAEDLHPSGRRWSPAFPTRARLAMVMRATSGVSASSSTSSVTSSIYCELMGLASLRYCSRPSLRAGPAPCVAHVLTRRTSGRRIDPRES